VAVAALAVKAAASEANRAHGRSGDPVQPDRVVEPQYKGRKLHGMDQLESIDPEDLNLDDFVDSFEFEHGVSFEESLGAALEQSGVSPERPSDCGLAEQVTSLDELRSFVTVPDDDDMHGGGVLGLFHPDMREGATPPWLSFAALSEELAHLGLRFAFSSSPEVLEAYDIEAWRLLVFKPPRFAHPRSGEEFEVVFPSREASEKDRKQLRDAMEAFIVQHAAPSVGEITYENEELYVRLAQPVAIVYGRLGELDTEARNKQLDKLVELARRIRERTSPQPRFAVVDSMADIYLLRYFSAELAFTPSERLVQDALRLAVRLGPSEYVKMDGVLRDAASAAEFVSDAVSGRGPAALRLEGQYEQAASGRDEL